MVKQLEEEDGYLYQQVAVFQIIEEFGEDFTYINRNGNLGIRPDVLNAFRDLTADNVVWIQRDRAWRKREEFDAPGKRKADW